MIRFCSWKALLAVATLAGLALAAPARADEKDKDKNKGDKKVTIIQIDLDKLPPDVAKRLLELSKQAPAPAKDEKKGAPPAKDEKKGAPVKKGDEKKGPPDKKEAPKAGEKSISLAQAIAIAEKAGKGTAVKAERKDHPEVQFRIELSGADGNTSKVTLDAAGKVMGEKKDEGKKAPPEGGKKKEEEKGKKKEEEKKKDKIEDKK